MKTRVELKTMAKEQIKGHLGMLILITIIIGAISYASMLILGMVPYVGSLISSFIILPAFTLSEIRIYLNLTAGQPPKVNDAFSGFDDFWTAFKVYFFVSLYTFLWSLLFIVPGIVKGISYSQAMYIVGENKGISAHEAINRSKEMMNGHKMDYFVLCLSFIGWILLCYVTFFIALLWVGPYMDATLTNFYNDIKPKKVDAIFESEVPSHVVAEDVTPAETVDEGSPDQNMPEDIPTEE